MTRGLFPLFWYCFHQMNGDLKKAKNITFPDNPLKTDWSFALARFTYFLQTNMHYHVQYAIVGHFLTHSLI